MKERKPFQELDSQTFLEEIRIIALERASELLSSKKVKVPNILNTNALK